MFSMVMGVTDMKEARGMVNKLMQTELGCAADRCHDRNLCHFIGSSGNSGHLGFRVRRQQRSDLFHSGRGTCHPETFGCSIIPLYVRLKGDGPNHPWGTTSGVPLSVCGEAVGDPKVTCLLVGMDVRKLSMNSFLVDGVRDVIRQLTVGDWQRGASVILAAPTPEDV